MKEGNRKLLARGGRRFPEGPWNDLRSLFASVAEEPTLFNARKGTGIRHPSGDPDRSDGA